jgi:phosphoribosylaminoimidazole carboxylase PurE protein
MKDSLVTIIMGSDSDLGVVSEGIKVLKEFGVKHTVRVASAHRTPEVVYNIVKAAEENGVKVIIAAAGAAAHLGGVIAAHTNLPVIGIPIDATSFGGMDALLSTVQMPGGVPVASMAVGKAGAKNAAIFALQILALSDERIKKQLIKYKQDMKKKVVSKDKKVQKLIGS